LLEVTINAFLENDFTHFPAEGDSKALRNVGILPQHYATGIITAVKSSNNVGFIHVRVFIQFHDLQFAERGRLMMIDGGGK
jgi:hypothetical protein